MNQYAASASDGVFITFSRWAPPRVAVDLSDASDRRRMSPPRCRLWHRWGGSHRYRGIAWRSVHRLVFLYMENACAGAYAERRAQALGLAAISLGLGATAGTDIPAVAALVATGRGIDLAGHCLQAFDARAIRPTDLLIGFEPAHCAHAAALLGRGGRPQVALLALGERNLGTDAQTLDRGYARIDQALALLQREQGLSSRRPPEGAGVTSRNPSVCRQDS